MDNTVEFEFGFKRVRFKKHDWIIFNFKVRFFGFPSYVRLLKIFVCDAMRNNNLHNCV